MNEIERKKKIMSMCPVYIAREEALYRAVNRIVNFDRVHRVKIKFFSTCSAMNIFIRNIITIIFFVLKAVVCPAHSRREKK